MMVFYLAVVKWGKLEGFVRGRLKKDVKVAIMRLEGGFKPYGEVFKVRKGKYITGWKKRRKDG